MALSSEMHRDCIGRTQVHFVIRTFPERKNFSDAGCTKNECVASANPDRTGGRATYILSIQQVFFGIIGPIYLPPFLSISLYLSFAVIYISPPQNARIAKRRNILTHFYCDRTRMDDTIVAIISMKNISHCFRKNLEKKQKLEKDNCEFSNSYKIFENKCRL